MTKTKAPRKRWKTIRHKSEAEVELLRKQIDFLERQRDALRLALRQLVHTRCSTITDTNRIRIWDNAEDTLRNWDFID